VWRVSPNFVGRAYSRNPCLCFGEGNISRDLNTSVFGVECKELARFKNEVGFTLIALTYILTLEDPHRFQQNPTPEKKTELTLYRPSYGRRLKVKTP